MARFVCEGSNREPLPSVPEVWDEDEWSGLSPEDQAHKYRKTIYKIGDVTVTRVHHERVGICRFCHSEQRLLKTTGLLRKHTRHVSWKEQQTDPERFAPEKARYR